MIEPRASVLDLAAYELADLSAPPGKRLVQLAQNEAAFGPSPAVEQAMVEAVKSANLYPDPDFAGLRTAIADVHGLNRDSLLCGCGSMELISLLTGAYLQPGSSAVSSRYSYLFFRTAVKVAGAENLIAEEDDLTVDVDALLVSVRDDTKMVFVANPGNPTGSMISRAELIRLRDNLADDIMLVVDEAYAEFADPSVYEPVFDLVARGNTVVLRTFSKIYGLAGLRVGWGCFPPEVIDVVRRIQHPNSVAAVSQAGAEAAVRDQAYVAKVRAESARLRSDFSTALSDLPCEVCESATNFILVRFADQATASSAKDALFQEGIIVRAMGGYGLSHCLRITLGLEEDMKRVASLLKDWHQEEGRSA